MNYLTKFQTIRKYKLLFMLFLGDTIVFYESGMFNSITFTNGTERNNSFGLGHWTACDVSVGEVCKTTHMYLVFWHQEIHCNL